MVRINHQHCYCNCFDRFRRNLIRRREVEYGVAFDKAQWIWMGILIIDSIILDIWLGSTKIPLRIAMIVIQAVIALILTWLVGRRKPANATK